MRFFYNLGIEYFKFLNHVYGYGTVMSMMDGDNVGNAYDQPANEDGDGHSNQMVSEFQHLHLESAEGDTQSPKVFNHSAIKMNHQYQTLFISSFYFYS